VEGHICSVSTQYTIVAVCKGYNQANYHCYIVCAQPYSIWSVSYNLFPATNTIHTMRWPTVDTSTTISPAPSCSAGANEVMEALEGSMAKQPVLSVCLSAQKSPDLDI
jgi:hypothetical protein